MGVRLGPTAKFGYRLSRFVTVRLPTAGKAVVSNRDGMCETFATSQTVQPRLEATTDGQLTTC
jgi:hypothetical protein